jgi:phosphoglycerate dehydrogenase-like enzyme
MAEVDIVLIGNIARSGRTHLEAHLEVPHRIREYPCDLAEAEVLVGSPVPRRMIENAPRLRLVHVSGAGYDNLDLAALPAGVALCNVFHHERAMAEYILMTVLALDRDLFRQDRGLRQGRWDGSCVAGLPVATELAGKTLGILGYGHIGREAARLAAPFEMRVRGLRSDHTRQQFEALLAESDYLVVACPLNDRTRGILGAREFGLMKPTAALISIARGEVVDERALYDALSRRRIRGAAIDVWYRYPRDGETCLPSSLPFQELDNVILTPHSSGWTARVLALRFRDIARNINRLVRGEPLENPVRRGG